MGYIANKNGEWVSVYVVVNPFEPDNNWTDSEKNEYIRMQDIVNSLIAQMGLSTWEDTLELPDPVPEATGERLPLKELQVETEYGTFTLSGNWNGEMRSQINAGEAYTVSLYGKIGDKQEVHLFDIRFGGSEGDRVGYVAGKDGKPVPVYVVLSDFEPDDSWTEDEKAEFSGMQSELNSIIGVLEMIDGSGSADTPAAEDMKTQTPYGTLVYPGTWGDRIRTESKDGTPYAISFYGTPTGQKEIHLFDLIFDGDGENTVGILKLSDGNEISVEAIVSAFTPDESWSDAAVNEAFAMIDSINYLLSGLNETGSFRYFG